MKAERVDETQQAKHRKPKNQGIKPKRLGEHGPLGFNNVMRDVTDPKRAHLRTGVHADGSMDLAAEVALSMGKPLTIDQLDLNTDSSIKASTASKSNTDVSPQINLLGKMTPKMLLNRVVDEATKLAIERASKELHVELEPQHLGPLVVSLRKDNNGALDIRFRAKRGDAARVLDAGSSMLRERLAEAGFPSISLAIEQDPDLDLKHPHSL